MLQLFRKERVLPQAHDLKRTYDVVIIGAGVHGLATAYYLGKEHGITNVAVLEKSYLGAGNSGRNTAILRANYRTPEGIPFFAASLELYEQLSQELGWNVLFSQCGHLTLAHNDSAVAGLRLRAETNNLYGVENRVIDRRSFSGSSRPSTARTGHATRYSRPSTTRRAVLSATTRSCGATPALVSAWESRFIPSPKRPRSASTARRSRDTRLRPRRAGIPATAASLPLCIGTRKG